MIELEVSIAGLRNLLEDIRANTDVKKYSINIFLNLVGKNQQYQFSNYMQVF